LHDAAAFPGACGVWQLVQPWCSFTMSAASVGFFPWHPLHAAAPPATNSCGLWQVTQASWPAGFGPAGCPWHPEHVATAAAPGVCGEWQSSHPFEPAWAACCGARTSWQDAQAFSDVNRSPCIVWQSAQLVEPCSWIVACTPCVVAWQSMHVASLRPGSKAWHRRQSIFAAPLSGCVCVLAFSWHLAQGAEPGFLNPSRSKSWQSLHETLSSFRCAA
jgi:hypothetical protein